MGSSWNDAVPGLAKAGLGWRALVNAGANDFGGISPLTKDYVNPEKPWPHIADLAAAIAACGKGLVPRCSAIMLHALLLWSAVILLLLYVAEVTLRSVCHENHVVLFCRLTVYPETVKQAEQWFDSSGGRNSILAAVLRQADGSGLARGSNWCPGLSTQEEKAETANPVIDRDGGAHASTSEAGMCQLMGLFAVHPPECAAAA